LLPVELKLVRANLEGLQGGRGGGARGHGARSARAGGGAALASLGAGGSENAGTALRGAECGSRNPVRRRGLLCKRA
jgi:hypothetical protein